VAEADWPIPQLALGTSGWCFRLTATNQKTNKQSKASKGSTFSLRIGPPKSASKAGPSTPPYVADFLGSREGHAIMKAFHRIADRKQRLKIVALAEELAGL